MEENTRRTQGWMPVPMGWEFFVVRNFGTFVNKWCTRSNQTRFRRWLCFFCRRHPSSRVCSVWVVWSGCWWSRGCHSVGGTGRFKSVSVNWRTNMMFARNWVFFTIPRLIVVCGGLSLVGLMTFSDWCKRSLSVTCPFRFPWHAWSQWLTNWAHSWLSAFFSVRVTSWFTIISPTSIPPRQTPMSENPSSSVGFVTTNTPDASEKWIQKSVLGLHPTSSNHHVPFVRARTGVDP